MKSNNHYVLNLCYGNTIYRSSLNRVEFFWTSTPAFSLFLFAKQRSMQKNVLMSAQSEICNFFGSHAAEWMSLPVPYRYGPRVRILHTAAVWENPHTGRLYLIAVGNERTPRSATDWFLLNASRARSDACIITGKVLREEPDTVMGLDNADHDENPLKRFGLGAWRRAMMKRSLRPQIAVLSRYSKPPPELERHPYVFPPGHQLTQKPLWISPNSDTYETSLCSEWEMREVNGIRGAIQLIAAQLPEGGTILLEAGSSAAALYQSEEPIITELMLSVYRGPLHPELIIEPPFALSLSTIEAYFPRKTAWLTESIREGGSWSFAFFLRE